MLLSFDQTKFVLHLNFYEYNKYKNLLLTGSWRWDKINKVWYTPSVEDVNNLKHIPEILPHLKNLSLLLKKSYQAFPSLDFANIPELELLRDYQKAGVEFLFKSKNTILADEMGLGKTAQVISLVSLMSKIKKTCLNVVVVCPAHLKFVWVNEVDKFAFVPFNICLWKGSSYSEFLAGNQGDYLLKHASVNLHIINYDILKKNVVNLPNSIDVLVFDEAHYLKNKNAQRTKISIKLTKNVKEDGKVILISGTPLTKTPICLYPLLKIIKHPIADNWLYYAKRYCDLKEGRFGYEYGASNLNELGVILRMSCMLRRTKQQVAKEIPPKIIQIITLDKTGLEDLLKEEISTLSVNFIKPDDFLIKYPTLKPEVMTKLAHIRQQIAIKKIPVIVSFIDDILTERINEKIVIYAHHLSVIQTLYKVLSRKYPVSYITSEVSQVERERIVYDFQNKEKPQILIVSVTAGGTGLTLTRAKIGIFVELDWIPSTIMQAEDRLHRISQTETVFIYYMVVEDSIESYIAKKMLKRESDLYKVLT